jgi:hypothetical protein
MLHSHICKDEHRLPRRLEGASFGSARTPRLAVLNVQRGVKVSIAKWQVAIGNAKFSHDGRALSQLAQAEGPAGPLVVDKLAVAMVWRCDSTPRSFDSARPSACLCL